MKLHSEVIKDGDEECGTVTVYRATKNSDGTMDPPGAVEGAHVFEFVPKKKDAAKKDDEKKKKEEQKEGDKKDDKKDDKKEADRCCGGTGFAWIQHVSVTGEGDWRFDNAALRPPGGPARGFGAPSDPDKSPQPSEKDRPVKDGKPVQSTDDDRWRENPWYGAPTDPAADKEKFAINPQPQQTIGDKPGGSDHFRTQLVCANGGKVWFDWEWASGKDGKKH